MSIDLPHAGGTDGTVLVEQAQHALILDMTTRSGGVWPRYGTSPGHDQSDDGREEIFTASMMAALEWGLFSYAESVLDNYFTYFVRHDGTIWHRGLDMAKQGRILTCVAMYYEYTRDDRLIVKHLDKIDALARLLKQRYLVSIWL